MLHTIAGFDRIGEENAFAVLARAQKLAAEGRDIINLGIGQPDFRTPEHIVEAAIKALRDGHHGYTAATGIPPLREAVAADLNRRFGVTISPDRVLIVPGGKVTMHMAILMFGEPGADILYPDPGFPIYRSMIEFTGARPIPVPIREENGFAFSAEETRKLITPQTRLLIVNSPANPTGGVTPRVEIEEGLRLQAKKSLDAMLAMASGTVGMGDLGPVRVMARYFFHVQNQVSYVRDEIGSDLPSQRVARSRAAEAAGEILTSDLRDGRTQITFDIQVDNEAGARLFTISVAGAVAFEVAA
eukprot:gene30644-34793_t